MGALALALAIVASPVRAEVPRVAVDIPPVHSLVARVMDRLGDPDLVMGPGASPHGYAMRPSEAIALESSDVIFWVGEALTPWLGREIDALAPDAVTVPLMSLPGTRRLERREGAAFAAHGNHDGHGAEAAGAHDDEHGEEHGDERHDHGSGAHGTPYDPHGWLDPTNARTWLAAIADTLAALDPDNAARYRANATAGQREIDALLERTAERLAPVRERRFVVFHDSFQYFESRFGVTAAGALSPDDASAPSPARLQSVRKTITRLDVGCAFAEPQFDPARLYALVDGLPLTIGTLDPLGAALEPGPELYGRLVEGVAETLLGCLDG